VFVYVCTDPGIPVFGHKGASIHVRSVLAEAVRRGYETHLFAARLGGPHPGRLRDVHIHRLACPGGPTAEREQALMAADDELAALMSAFAHVDVVYQRYSLWSCAALELAAQRGWPSVLEINAPLLDEQARHRELVDVDSARRRTVSAIRLASAPYAVSPAVARWAGDVSGAQVAVVANGVDPSRFSVPPAPPEADSSVAPADLVAGFVGGFRPWHDVESVIRAVAEANATMTDTRIGLLLVGDGPGLPAALACAEEAGVAVEATGSVAADAVPGLLARMDLALALYPPGEHYFSPLKVFEYLAAGLPVVASRVGGLEELFVSGDELLLCEPGDTTAVIEALRALCADAGLRRSLGGAARSAVVEQHSWSAVFDRVLALLAVPMGAT